MQLRIRVSIYGLWDIGLFLIQGVFYSNPFGDREHFAVVSGIWLWRALFEKKIVAQGVDLMDVWESLRGNSPIPSDRVEQSVCH